MNEDQFAQFAAVKPYVPHAAAEEKSLVGILVADAVMRRMLESASSQLALDPRVLTREELSAETLDGVELLVADEAVALELRDLIAKIYPEPSEAFHLSIIALRAASREPMAEPDPEADRAFAGVLQLPLTPAMAAAQLSLLHYAHRAFAARYRTAFEELHLNRRIFRSVTSGISVATASEPDLPLTYVNPAFEVMTGYALEEVQGKNCRFLQREERDQPAVTLIREAIAAKREVTTILRNYRKDGTPFWNELALSPIFNRQGELTHFVGIQTDVTARVEFEDALRESEKLAAVGRLASSIAHEINNPLESVMNLLYLAQNALDAEESKRYVALADKELQRVSLITSQSLRFYKQSTRPQAITCAALLDSVLDLYDARAENSGVRIERRERSKLSIVCLESEIRQVLNNLVRNALDAMHTSGGGRLLIRTREAVERRPGAAARQGVTITVADTGSGIAPETMANLYKAFFTTKGIAGTGLGLWLSRDIVQRHQGSLRVRSRVSPTAGGTVFELFLPLQVLPT